MRVWATSIFGLLAVILMSASVAANASKVAPVTAIIEKESDNWSVEYQLNARHKIWAFVRSKPDRQTSKSWRMQSWIVITKGVRIAEMDGYDVLIADKGFVPNKVKILFVPWSNDLNADYDPAIKFSTGDIALFDEHFSVGPYDKATGLSSPANAQINRFSDKSGQIWRDGSFGSTIITSGKPRYILFGRLRPVENARLNTVIDPGMPDWLKNDLDKFTPKLVDDFATLFGVEGTQEKPSIWASWGGTKIKGMSTGGSVLPGFISASIAGDALVKENSRAKHHFYWFLAHEVAHFWLGQRANYAGDGHQWISEGGANAAALLYLKATLADYDFKAEVEEQIKDCRNAAERGALRTGYQRGDYQGYYSCGALFNLVADRYARTKGGSFFTFNGALIKAADSSDNKISGEEWLAAFAEMAKKPDLVDAISRLVEGKSNDSNKDIDLIVDETGILVASKQ